MASAFTVCVELDARWPLRLAGGGRDGVTRRRGGVFERLLHVGGAPAVVGAVQLAPTRVRLAAGADRRSVALCAIERMGFALGVDDDLRPFYDRFRSDPLIGRSVRVAPWLRLRRRPVAFEALAWAICEQLITAEEAAAIERRIVLRFGPRCERTGLRDVPSAARVAALAPAELEACGLAASRSLALVRAAREVAAGRVDLDDRTAPERGWRRLRAIPGIGSWTVERLAVAGQGRFDQLPAGDVAYLKLVGRLLGGGSPRARVEESDVREFFAPYAPWGALAVVHALRATRGGLRAPVTLAA